MFRQYQQDIYRIAYVYVKNKEDALDIVQETACRAYIKFDSLSDENKAKSWLIRIAIHCAIDFIRKNKKVTNINIENVEPIPYHESDIVFSLSLKELINSSINETEKSILVLKYYEGYNFNEIATIMDSPVSTVKSILYRALGKIKLNIEREDLI
jgi:RNA polymerase sigma-70 factor, ECF subfamily